MRTAYAAPLAAIPRAEAAAVVTADDTLCFMLFAVARRVDPNRGPLEVDGSPCAPATVPDVPSLVMLLCCSKIVSVDILFFSIPPALCRRRRRRRRHADARVGMAS